MKKSLFVTLICLFLALSMVLAGCGPKEAEVVETEEVKTAEPTEVVTEAPTEAPEEVTMFTGIYEERFTPPGYGEYVGYFHFYENGVVYVSLYNNGQYMAGYYEIVDEGKGWDPKLGEPDHEFDVTAATTDKTIIITNFDGSEYARVGYDTALDMVVNLESYYNKNFKHIIDSPHTPEDETGVNVIELYKEDDDYSLVALKHNGTFEDSIDMIIEGTWVKEGDIFTLTDADSGETYTITMNEDGTGAYAGLDGTTLTLVPPKEKAVTLSFAGTLAEAAYGEMKGTTYLYEDETAAVVINYAGVDNTIEGTWKLGADYNITLTLDGVDYLIPLNYETQLFGDFVYTTTDGVNDVELVMAQVVPGPKYTWVGTNPSVVLEMYPDGTCKLNYVGMGTVTQGTWTEDNSGPLPQFTITLDETFESQLIEVTTDYKTAFFFTFKNGSGQLEDTLSLTFADYQAANPQQ